MTTGKWKVRTNLFWKREFYTAEEAVSHMDKHSRWYKIKWLVYPTE